MIRILLVFKDNGLKPDFVNGLVQSGKAEVEISENGDQALKILGDKKFDLAVAAETLTDMTGIAFIEKLIMINPMINTAVASDLPKDDFHEATEGLGVLMAVPLNAGKEDALYLLDYLDKILNITP